MSPSVSAVPLVERLSGLLAVRLLPVLAGDTVELLAVVLPAGTASFSSLGR